MDEQCGDLVIHFFAKRGGRQRVGARGVPLVEQVQTLETNLEVVEHAIELVWVEHRRAEYAPSARGARAWSAKA